MFLKHLAKFSAIGSGYKAENGILVINMPMDSELPNLSTTNSFSFQFFSAAEFQTGQRKQGRKIIDFIFLNDYGGKEVLFST